MSITVLKPGMLSTVQDRGRRGFQHLGVPVSGAMDFYSHRIANILAVNDPRSATLEITLRGPRLRFDDDALIALCGADLSPAIDGIAVPEGKAVRVRSGAILEFGAGVAGCRAYLAVHGGFDVPEVMGSRSTYDTARIGGLDGRALRMGDVLPLGVTNPAPPYPGLAQELSRTRRNFSFPKWAVNQHIEKLGRSPQILRILPGRHWDAFPAGSREALTAGEFRMGADSNRMGCRLEGPAIAGGPAEILSEAVTFGTIQIPPSGKPIVLAADRQTVGGYPKIAEVAGVDLHLLAQLRPGDRLRFELVSLAQAQALWLKREQEIIMIREAVEKHLNE